MGEPPVSRLITRPRVIILLSLVAIILVLHSIFSPSSANIWSFHSAQPGSGAKAAPTDTVKTTPQPLTSTARPQMSQGVAEDPSDEYILTNTKSTSSATPTSKTQPKEANKKTRAEYEQSLDTSGQQALKRSKERWRDVKPR